MPNRQPGSAALPTDTPTEADDVVAFVAPAQSASLQGLVRRHGHRTEGQRAKLRASVQRHVNAGYLHLDEANVGLARLGLDPLHGPGTVTFRLRVAKTVVHEDDETDAAMLRCTLDEVQLRWSRVVGVHGKVHVSPPRLHPGSGRRRARACAEVLIAVTVRACPAEDGLVVVATGLLYDDVSLLHQSVDIIDAPVVHDAGPSLDTRQAGTTVDSASQETASHDSASHDSASHDSASHDSASHDSASHDSASHDGDPDGGGLVGRFDDGDGDQRRDGDQDGDRGADGSWDRFLDGSGRSDAYDLDDYGADVLDDGDVDWRYPDCDRPRDIAVDTDGDVDLDGDVDWRYPDCDRPRDIAVDTDGDVDLDGDVCCPALKMPMKAALGMPTW